MDHRRPWGWTEEDYEMLAVLFEQGLTNDEIAQATDRASSTIAGALRARGLNRGANNCLACGAVLIHPKSGRRRRYCNSKCGEAYRQGRPTQKDTAATARQARPVCSVCHAELTSEQVRRRLSKKLSLDYCSGNCRQQAQSHQVA